MIISNPIEIVQFRKLIGTSKTREAIKADIEGVETYLKQPLFTNQEKEVLDSLIKDMNWRHANRLKYTIFLRVLRFLKNQPQDFDKKLLDKINRFLKILNAGQNYLKNIFEQKVSGKNLREIQKWIAVSFLDWIASLSIDEAAMGHIIAPAGVGKTLMAMILDEMMLSRKTVFVVDSLINGHQTIDSFQEHQSQKNADSQKTISKIFGKKNKMENLSDLSVMNFDNIFNHFQLTDFSKTDLIIIDEADINGLSSKRAQWLKKAASEEGMIVVGMSATEMQRSGKQIKHVFPHTIYRMGIPEGLPQCFELKMLAPTRFFDVYVDIDKQNDFPSEMLSEIERRSFEKQKMYESVNHDALKHYLEFHRGEGALFGFANKKQLRSFVILARSQGLKVGIIRHGQLESERIHKINFFKQGKMDILCGFKIIGRGLDIPSLKIAYNLQFTLSPQLFWQFAMRPSRLDLNNPDKIATTYNFVPQPSFEKNAQINFKTSRTPLTFSAFFDPDYFDWLRTHAHTGLWQPGYRRKSNIIKSYDLSHLQTIRSVKEVVFGYRNKFGEHSLQKNIEKWLLFFKEKRHIHSPAEWLDIYPNANVLTQDIGSTILSDLRIPYSGNGLKSSDHSKIFETLFNLKIFKGYRLKWKKKIIEAGINSPAQFLEAFPENRSGTEKLVKIFGAKLFSELAIAKSENIGKKHYAAVFRRVWGMKLSRFYLRYWRLKILYDLDPKQITNEVSDYEKEKILTTLTSIFLMKYPGPFRFKKKFDLSILKNLGIEGKILNQSHYQNLFVKLFFRTWQEGWKNVVLHLLNQNKVFNSVDAIDLFLNHQEFLKRMIGIEILNQFSFFKESNDLKKLYELLYGHSFQEGLKISLTDKLKKSGIYNEFDFVDQFQSADQFIKKFGFSVLKGIQVISKSKSKLFFELIPFLYGITYQEALSKYWRIHYLQNDGIKNIEDYVSLFPNYQSVHSQIKLLKSYQSVLGYNNLTRFSSPHQDKTVYDYILFEVFGMFPPVLERCLYLHAQKIISDKWAERINVLYFLLSDLVKYNYFDPVIPEYMKVNREHELLTKYKELYQKQKNIVLEIFGLTSEKLLQIKKELFKVRKLDHHKVSLFLANYLNKSVSLTQLQTLTADFIKIQNDKNALVTQMIQFSYSYLGKLSKYYAFIYKLNSDQMEDVKQAAIMNLARAMDRVDNVGGWFSYKASCMRGVMITESINIKYQYNHVSLDETVSCLDKPVTRLDMLSKEYALPEEVENIDKKNNYSERLKNLIVLSDYRHQIYLHHRYPFFGELPKSDKEISELLGMQSFSYEYKKIKDTAELCLRETIDSNPEFKAILLGYYELIAS